MLRTMQKKSWIGLKSIAFAFGLLHLAATYGLLLTAMASGMARFDGGAGSLSPATEEVFMYTVKILLFPFGYLQSELLEKLVPFPVLQARA